MGLNKKCWVDFDKNCGHHSENTYGYKIVGVWFMSIFNS